MTTTTASLAQPTTDVGRLKAVLLANATTSLTAGLVAAIATNWVVDRLGLTTGAASWTRLVGVGLVLFALAVGYVALDLQGESQRRAARLVSAADLSWVVATVIVLATVDLSTFGVVAAIVMGLGVLDFALLQLRFSRPDHG